MKNNRGITLIALVITIIVLLILAGVSIAMLTGDNGILTRATESSSATNLAEVLERVNMELNAQFTNVLAGDPFDGAEDINPNIANLPGGYTATAVVTNSSTYDTNATVTITITKPATETNVTLTQAEGKVSYEDGAWKIKPVTGSVN